MILKTTNSQGNVHTTDRSIAWLIGTLKAGETATMQVTVRAGERLISVTKINGKNHIMEIGNDNK